MFQKTALDKFWRRKAGICGEQLIKLPFPNNENSKFDTKMGAVTV